MILVPWGSGLLRRVVLPIEYKQRCDSMLRPAQSTGYIFICGSQRHPPFCSMNIRRIHISVHSRMFLNALAMLLRR